MISRKGLKSKNFNILFTCIGRRVSLLNSFKKAANELKLNCRFFGADSHKLSPALQLCDEKVFVKPIKHPNYIPDLLRIVKKNKIELIIPTIDTDLEILSENKIKFNQLGCQVLISEPRVVRICQDKRKTYSFFKKNGFGTPETFTAKTVLTRKKNHWPMLLKPWDGAAGKGIATVNNRKELSVFSKRIKNCIVQEFIKGIEYTCDVFVDFDGNVRCVVPRKRIEIRAGEVSKGQVVKNKLIMNKAAELVKCLGAGPGVITVQLILAKDKKIKFVEINPRFGGGAPLSIEAGANFPKWILQSLCGKNYKIKFDGFKNKLIMLRYDAEIWLKNS